MTDIPKLPRIKQDDENMEKLHVAARKGQADHIRRLLELGINPSIENKFGCSALHLACKHSQVAVVRELLAVGCGVTQAWHGQKVLHLAVVANNHDIVSALAEGVRQQGKAALDNFLNDCDDFEYIISVTDVENLDNMVPRTLQGQTPLQWCIGLGESHTAMLELLLSLGASPNSKDKNNETPIMRTIECKNIVMFDLILRAASPGALRLDICDKQGRSPLHYAITYNQTDVALQLLRLGHEVGMEDQNRVTIIVLCMRAAMPRVMEIVLEVADQFMVLTAPFHNGFFVLPERIEWLPFATASDKAETISIFQAKLEAINKANAPAPSPEDGKKRKKKSTVDMTLAPSAPIKIMKRKSIK